MKVLVIGERGQLGRALGRRPAPAGAAVTRLGRDEADLARPDRLRRAVAAHAPDLVVIAAAYTAVDQAEDDSRTAYAVNGRAPGVLAEAAAAVGAAVLHVSTDYVFDGAPGAPWREDDPVGPVNVYGASKLLGEQAVAVANPRHAILRTSWVFDAEGPNFLRTMLRLAGERDAVSVVDDQIGRPTAAEDLADAIWAIAPRLVSGAGPFGVLHGTNGGEPVSWAGFAERIFALSAPRLGRTPVVRRIATADYPTRARRPLNSVLSLARLRDGFGVAPRAWEAALDGVLAQIEAQEEKTR
ncbi:MAG: dTDP-4-dehydrorhamnose reductase [Pseudomonadota bacterium]